MSHERVIHHKVHALPLTHSIITGLVQVIETLLAFRFVLKMLGANTASWFTQFIYGLSGALVEPLRGTFPVTAEQGIIFEWSTVVAMAVYALLAYVIKRIIYSFNFP